MFLHKLKLIPDFSLLSKFLEKVATLQIILVQRTDKKLTEKKRKKNDSFRNFVTENETSLICV